MNESIYIKILYMRIFNFRKKHIEPSTEQRSGTVYDQHINYTFPFLNSEYGNSQALKIAAVYRAVELISDSIAVLPINIFEYKGDWKYKTFNELWNLLNIAPNNNMISFNFKKLIIQQMLIKGNSYVFIERDKDDNPLKFTLLNPDKMVVKSLIEGGVIYEYDNKHYFDQYDIIHIKNHILDSMGLQGVSTLTYGMLTFENSYNAENHANNWFKGGSTMRTLLSPKTGFKMDQKKASDYKNKLVKTLNPSDGGNSNQIIIVDDGLEFTNLSISPKEAQLLENRTFNILNIAQMFGVPPSKLI
jgi:HK97 family phage portal protein